MLGKLSVYMFVYRGVSPTPTLTLTTIKLNTQTFYGMCKRKRMQCFQKYIDVSESKKYTVLQDKTKTKFKFVCYSDLVP